MPVSISGEHHGITLLSVYLAIGPIDLGTKIGDDTAHLLATATADNGDGIVVIDYKNSGLPRNALTPKHSIVTVGYNRFNQSVQLVVAGRTGDTGPLGIHLGHTVISGRNTDHGAQVNFIGPTGTDLDVDHLDSSVSLEINGQIY